MAKKPSFNDLNFYVKWADLEDALKGLRSELSNLQAQSLQNLKPVERVVIEQSMQTEVKNEKNENCTMLIRKGNSCCHRKSSAWGPLFKVSSEGL